MMNKSDIIKLTKHVFKRGQGIPDRRLMHPVRDWWIGLSISLCIVIGGGAWAAWQYVQYANLTIAQDVPEVQIIRYNAAQVERAIELYSPRAEGFADATPPPPPAPVEPVSATSSPSTPPTPTETLEEGVTTINSVINSIDVLEQSESAVESEIDQENTQALQLEDEIELSPRLEF